MRLIIDKIQITPAFQAIMKIPLIVQKSKNFFVDHSRDKKLSTKTLMEEVEQILEEK